jgi:hypothetical protein
MHKAVDDMATVQNFHGYGPSRAMNGFAAPSCRTTTPPAAHRSKPMKSSSATAPSATPATSRKSLVLTTSLPSPTRSIRSMWIPTSWPAAPAKTTARAVTARLSICPARRKTVSFPNCPSSPSILSTCAIPTIRPAPSPQKSSSKNGRLRHCQQGHHSV